MRRTPRLALLIGLPALVAAAALGSVASAQGPAGETLTLTELERGSTFTHIRNTKAASRNANLQGDLIVFTNPLADGAGKRVGTLHASCVTTTGARDFRRSVLTCHVVMVLRGGTLTGQATTSPGVPTTNGTVTGGTGAYANARGVFVSKETERGSVDTISLVG